MDETCVARRRDAVHAAQRSLNMAPRDDSRLTELFARGELAPHMTPEVVARELMCTDFVYQHTLYGELIQDYMRCVANALRERYCISWSATWDVVRFYAPIALKLMCVSSCGVRMPPKLPASVPTERDAAHAVAYQPNEEDGGAAADP